MTANGKLSAKRRTPFDSIRARQGRAAEGRGGQGRAGQDRMGQDRAGQGSAGQGRVGQDRMGQGRAGQDRTGVNYDDIPIRLVPSGAATDVDVTSMSGSVAVQQCPPEVFATYTYIKDGSGCSGSSSKLDFCVDLQSARVDYSLCSIKILFSGLYYSFRQRLRHSLLFFVLPPAFSLSFLHLGL